MWSTHSKSRLYGGDSAGRTPNSRGRDSHNKQRRSVVDAAGVVVPLPPPPMQLACYSRNRLHKLYNAEQFCGTPELVQYETTLSSLTCMASRGCGEGFAHAPMRFTGVAQSRLGSFRFLCDDRRQGQQYSV